MLRSSCLLRQFSALDLSGSYLRHASAMLIAEPTNPQTCLAMLTEGVGGLESAAACRGMLVYNFTVLYKCRSDDSEAMGLMPNSLSPRVRVELDLMAPPPREAKLR